MYLYDEWKEEDDTAPATNGDEAAAIDERTDVNGEPSHDTGSPLAVEGLDAAA